MSPRIIALIGTFDSKGEEFSFLRDRIESAGLRTLMIDVGVLGSSPFEADITRADVAAAANQEASAKNKRLSCRVNSAKRTAHVACTAVLNI